MLEDVKAPELDPDLDGQTEELKAIEQRIEHERTTSLLTSHGKKRGRNARLFLDEETALAEAERRAALMHTTPLLTRMPQNDRSRLYREQRRAGLLAPLVLGLAAAGAAVYVFYPTVLPEDLQNIDLEAIEEKVTTAIEDALPASLPDVLP